ncbi:hypothetical protein L3X38_004996 [Prunus dulcis]|uniref:No apical meristem-associated C-terminal domain-containing protein n=1 Tax=Prunus dulcis TaxID=3755 RepID=A0AAD4ZPY5_PRUDU|nr:hypothetical protein L3X38_004996 [Prunus dulcis]
MGPAVVLNEMPLRDSMTSDSPLDSPISQDSPIEKEPRPIGQKAAKAKKAGNSSNNNSKFLEEIARQNGIRIEMEQKRQDNELALQAEYAREREYLRKKDMDKTDRETMAMDTSHMSPETSHNAYEDLLIKHTGRTLNNQPPSLKDAKTPFDIFPVSLLIGSK